MRPPAIGDSEPMQFTGKAPTIGLTDAMREQHELDQLNALVVDSIAQDPAFQVLTWDRSHWICPYEGTLVPVSEAWNLAARAHLFRRKPWSIRRGGKPRPLFQVLEQRWQLHLESPAAAPFRQFDADGRWLNPITKAKVLLPRARSATDPRATADIARTLAGCRAAREPSAGFSSA